MPYQEPVVNTKIGDLLSGIQPLASTSRGAHYEIVSTVAYLLGIKKSIFENEHEPPKMEIYQVLERNKNAKIIRHLCLLRTQMELNFLKVCKAIQQDYRSIMTIPEIIPSDSLQFLFDSGVDVYNKKLIKEPGRFVVELNRNIQSRINNCRSLFPDFVSWDYLSDIFVMPNGLSEEGTKAQAELYYANLECYPYQAYMNWEPEDQGNILHSDQRFLMLLYQWHGDEFIDISLVSDVSDNTKENIYKFIEESDKTVFLVDCENSDPYSLCAAIRNLEPERLSKIEKIVLYDDVHAASAWESLSSYIDLPIEYILIERLKDNKSLADIKVAVRTCKEFYENNVDSFVLVSSDSDYWGMIESMPEAKFLVMVEHEKCSGAMKQVLLSNGIFYCYIDDFYTGDAQEIKHDALMRECTRRLKNALDLNINALFNEALETTRLNLSAQEKETFLKKHITGRLRVEVEPDGEVRITIDRK